MSPTSLARVSLKKALAPGRHSEAGLSSAWGCAGIGRRTGRYAGSFCGSSGILLSFGVVPTSVSRVPRLQPPRPAASTSASAVIAAAWGRRRIIAGLRVSDGPTGSRRRGPGR